MTTITQLLYFPIQNKRFLTYSADTLYNDEKGPVLQGESENVSVSRSLIKSSPFDFYPLELVDVALAHLQRAGLQPIEWRSLLQVRMNVPLSIRDCSWVLPDNDLLKASHILLHDLGLPLVEHTKLKTSAEGDYHTEGIYHRISKSTSLALVQHIVLYPASFVTLDVPSATCFFSDSTLEADTGKSLLCPQYLVPCPRTVYACLIRMMQRYPRQCATRSILASDLQELIDYHLMDVQMGYVDRDDEELVQKLDLGKRTQDAIRLVRSWDWSEDEEWYADALQAILEGAGRIEYLPWKTC